MSTSAIEPESDDDYPAIVLQMRPVLNLTEDQFFRFCQINQILRIERTAQRELIVMSPAGGYSGNLELKIMMQLGNWAERDGTGIAFSSVTGFRLPNKSVRSPDASWISNARWNLLSEMKRKKFPPLCPDFVVELRSPSDRISDLKAKMQEYIDNGARLGLLIVPETKQVFVYRPGQPIQQLDNCLTVACDPELPGFQLDCRKIWQAQ